MEKIISDLKKTAISAAQKTGEMVEIGKLKIAITNKKSKINDSYRDLGLALYTAQKHGAEEAEGLNRIISDNDALFAEKCELEKELASLKSQKKCADCGELCDEDNAFCPKCGAKFSTEG